MSDRDFPPWGGGVRRPSLVDPNNMDPSAGPVRTPSSQPVWSIPLPSDTPREAEHHYLLSIIQEQHRQIEFWKDQCTTWMGLFAQVMKDYPK